MGEYLRKAYEEANSREELLQYQKEELERQLESRDKALKDIWIYCHKLVKEKNSRIASKILVMIKNIDFTIDKR